MLVLRWTVSCALVGGIFSPDSPVQDAFAGSTEARLGDGEVPHEYPWEKNVPESDRTARIQSSSAEISCSSGEFHSG